MGLPTTIAVPTPSGMTAAEHREQADLLLSAGLRQLQGIDEQTRTKGMPTLEVQVQLATTQALLLAAHVHATLAGVR
jgi:hypothetical protein